MIVAALDLGSNSFHLLVAQVAATAGGTGLTRVLSRKRTLGIGAHVQASGSIPAHVLVESVDCIADLVGLARHFGDIPLCAVGTSAVRDAENQGEFLTAVERRTGVSVEVLSGDLEGRLAYAGACSMVCGLPARVAVIDIGGGSVEIALGENGSVVQVVTLPLGFLRMEPVVGLGGVLSQEWVAARVAARIADLRAIISAFAPQSWVFSGGTARAFAGVAESLLGLDSHHLERRHVQELAEDLVAASAARLAAYGVDPARTRTLGAGAAVLAALVDQLDVPAICVSEGGLREGVVLRHVRGLELRRPCAAGQATVFAQGA